MPFEVTQVEQTTFIDRIRTTSGLTGHPEFIIDTLKDLGLSKARIGAELGREQYLGISYLGLDQIMRGLSEAEFFDAADLILKTRVIKSPLEIEYLRRAARISAQAQKDTFAAIHAGMTERQIAQILRERLMELGAEKLSLLCVVAGPSEGGICLLPTDRVVKPGETIGFDVGVSYRGYWSDLARTASVGEPSAELDEFYAWMMTLRHECNMRLQPGRTPADVITVCNRMLSERGLSTMGVGRIGHGVGIETTEYPSLAAFEDITFEKGMVFACNPNFANRLGFINAEDNWAIDSGGPDLLSDPIAENRIPVAAA